MKIYIPFIDDNGNTFIYKPINVFKYMITAKQFLENCNCTSWFDKEDFNIKRTTIQF